MNAIAENGNEANEASPVWVDTLIVGGGISGLSVAHALVNCDRSVDNILLAESQPRVGGSVTSASSEGFLYEEGPNSFSPTPELLQLAVDVGLKDELILADRRLPRYVYWQGRLIALPNSPPSAVTSPILSPVGKLRALLGALGFVPPHVTSEPESVSDFIRRHLGPEVLQKLVEPFTSGVYAGNPDELEAASAFARIARLEKVGGSLVAGAILSRRQAPTQKKNRDRNLPKTQRGQLGSFQRGLQSLPEAIAGKLGSRVRVNWQAKSIGKTEGGNYLVEFATPQGHQQVEARSLVLATPAYVTANLLKSYPHVNSQQQQAIQALESIPYPPVACVVLGYPSSAFKKQPLHGFGNLIPRGQGIRTLGTIWGSSLFPGRAPEGWELLLNFIGGTTDPEIANLDQEQIAQLVHRDLCQTLLREDKQPKVLQVHLWKQAIPQYTIGHGSRLAAIDAGVRSLPGLFLCSNYSDGVAMGDCARRGYELAPRVAEYLQPGSYKFV
ncbi:protoporphyrinogen oxidase [Geitlerinema sp. PCC 9228]|uniref:protoporphyrinogen oxidase n=1 Tax=Geitlerinema sp. PCC 9228 TaxID=111611 RepID=UPI0008F98924|nr:protoporphyrinogen oxidase [Geitlerinema sp. PCC 9228]